MAVAVDARSTATGTTNSTKVTSWSHTTHTVGVGSNRALIYICTINYSNSAAPTGVTAVWDSAGANQSMTLIANKANLFDTSHANGFGGSQVFIFALRNPASGNKTISVNWTNGNNIAGGAISFTGVEQSSDAAAFAHVTTNSTNVPSDVTNFTVTSAVGNWAVFAYISEGFTTTTTGRWLHSINDASGSLYTDDDNIFGFDFTGASTVALNASNNSNDWAGAGVDVVAAASGPTNYTMPAGQGTITLAGQTAGLVYTPVQPATAPLMTGRSRLLKRPWLRAMTTMPTPGAALNFYSMPADVGTLTLAGQTAGVRRAYTLAATNGTLTLSGQTASLVKTGTAVHGAWDSTVSSATLSNGDRTAAGGFLFARSTDSHAVSGVVNYYAEVKLDSTVAGFIVNIGITDASLTNQIYTDSNGALSDSSGFLGTFPSLAFAAGDVVGIAYIPATGKVWIRVNNGNWNGSGTANPATNTGGINYASANPAFVMATQ